MNILLVNHYAGTPELGMEFRPYYMAKEWKKQGHEVLVIGGSYSHLRKKQPLPGRECIDGIDYYWVKTNKYQGNGLGRILSMFLFVFKLIFFKKKILKQFIPDVVIASSTYPLDVFPARMIAEKCNAKLIYEIHDLWPLSPMILGGYKKWHPFIVIMQCAENYAYNHCDKCISVLPNVREHVVKHGLRLDKLYIVPNGFHVDRNERGLELVDDYQYFFSDIRKKHKKILGYIGGHAISNALDLLVDAMHIIADSDIVAVLVGNGVEKKNLEMYVKKEGIRNVFFLESVDKRMVPALLKEMDVLYLGGKDNPLYQYGTSQTKLFDYFQAKKPIIQTISPPNNYVDDSRSGITVKSTPQDIADGIALMMSYPDEKLKEMGERGKCYCDKYFNYEKLASDFIKYINE